MKKTRFYSLDFSYSLRHHIGTVSAWVWVAILVVLLCLLQYGVWFWDQWQRPTLAQRLPDFDSCARPIAELNADWQKAIKRYEPLYPLMAAEDEVPVLELVKALDAMVPRAKSGEPTPGFRPDFRILSLVVERGKEASIKLKLLLPETDRKDYFAQSEAFFRDRLDAVAVAGVSGSTNKLSVSMSWEKGGAITPETIDIAGTLHVSLPSGADIAKFPPVAKDVAAASEIVAKWQKRVEEYKFVTRTPWYKKPLEWYAGTSGAADKNAVNFSDLLGVGKGVAEFERARAVNVNPLQITAMIVSGLSRMAKEAREAGDEQAVKAAKGKQAEATGMVEKFNAAWQTMASRRSPYSREKKFDTHELDEDLNSIRKVSAASAPRAKYIEKCLARAELHRKAISGGVQYKHVFEETTFRDRVVLPPVRKALAENGAEGWTVGLDGTKKDKAATSAKADFFFPEWSVGAGPDAGAKRDDAPPAPFDAVRKAVDNLEAGEARIWVTRLSVEFADGPVRPAWPAVKGFTIVGRVPCWRGETGK